MRGEAPSYPIRFRSVSDPNQLLQAGRPGQIKTHEYELSTTVVVIRETELTAVPWKNGGGVTREICRAPSDAPAFDWRLSLATIDRAGPFSIFDGYERILVLVRGAGMQLDFGERRARLSDVGQFVTFDGSLQTQCAPLDGPSTDLNLMVSKARAISQCRAVRLSTPKVIATDGCSETLLCCLSGSVRIQNAAGDVAELSSADVTRCAPTDGILTCQLRSATPANLFIAGLCGR